MLIVCIFVAIIAYLICRSKYDSIINPVAIFVSVNILSLLLSLIQDTQYSYSFDFCILVLIMFCSFFMGIFLFNGKKTRSAISPSLYKRSNLFNVIIAFGIVYDVAVLAYLANLFSSFSLIDFFLKMGEVNAYVTSDSYESSWFSYLTPLGLPLCLLCYFYLNGKNLFIRIQFIASFLYCLSPRRDSLFNLIIILTFFALSLYKDRHSIKELSKKIKVAILIASIAIVFVMSYTQTLMNKSLDKSISVFNSELPAGLTDPYLYISLNYPYLQKIDFDYSEFPNTPLLASGRLGYIILNRLFATDFDVRSDFELGFLNLDGLSFNTAPILYYSWLDFGFLFPLFFIIMGLISQKMYEYYSSDNVTHRIISCIWYTLLALSFRSYILIFLTIFLSFFYTWIIGKTIVIRK